MTATIDYERAVKDLIGEKHPALIKEVEASAASRSLAIFNRLQIVRREPIRNVWRDVLEGIIQEARAANANMPPLDDMLAVIARRQAQASATASPPAAIPPDALPVQPTPHLAFVSTADLLAELAARQPTGQ